MIGFLKFWWRPLYNSELDWCLVSYFDIYCFKITGGGKTQNGSLRTICFQKFYDGEVVGQSWHKLCKMITYKSLVARWRRYPNRLSLMNMNSKFPGGEVASHFWHKLWKIILKHHWWWGGEHIQTGSLWTIWIQKSLVARWRAIPDSSFENIFLKNHWWRASSYTWLDKLILKIIGGEVASISKQPLFDEY